MKATLKPEISRTIPLLIATCHCERSAAIRTPGFVATAIFLLTLVAFPAYAKYGGGSGTAEDPYQIATAADLIALGETPEDYDKHFILTADIDLAGQVFDEAVIAPDTDKRTDWFQGSPFTGVFDANGHTIWHLTIRGECYLGVFGQCSGAVKNFGVIDVNITGSGDYVGGLVGENGGSVTRCYSTGAVSSNGWRVGGLAGGSGSWDMPGSTVTNCYSTAAVSGSSYLGGLVGSSGGSVTQCYSTGAVTGIGKNVGGLLGIGHAIASFWDVQTSGQATSAGGTGKTTTEMQNIQTYLDAGWDFIGEIANGTSEIWQMPEGGCPILGILSGYTPPQLQGAGTPEDPYLISDAMELGAVVYYSPRGHYRLASSIDLSGIHWGTAVIPWFSGTFDGNSQVVSNLSIVGASYLGLFGEFGSGAEIKRVGLVGVSITGSGEYVGALVGSNGAWNTEGGTVTQCYSTGSVSGTSYVGGLMGCNEYRGTVAQCYSNGTVSGNDSVGGLVGANHYNSSLAQCYSTGAVTGTATYVGGLVGSNQDSRGRKGIITTSFWDIQTSGQAKSAGGTGKTTAEMQTAATFLDAGWYRCGEMGIWTIGDGLDYPRLRWENKPGEVIQPIILSLSDFLRGTGTQDDPYLIRTPEDISLIALALCDRAKHFRLVFVAGEGTQDSPYLIGTANELNLVGMCPYERDAHFKLMADIDLSAFDGKDGRPAFNIVGGHPWGFEDDKPFSGIFDGNGHTVSNFSHTCTETYNVGLFGYVSGPNSVVKNLELTWPNIDAGTGGVVGALVGYLEGGTVADCHIDGGSVSGGWEIGGLVGASYYGTITECNSSATVSGNDSVGGLVGYNQGAITYCDSGGRVLGDYSVGGLVGSNGLWECDWWECWEEPGTIYHSYSTAGVLGTGSNCGGLVGSNDAGEVARCYASGIVLGVSAVGGLAGWNGGKISSCYSTADVGGEKDVGGLVGLNSGGWLLPGATITNCYSTGIVLGDKYVGGLVGEGDVNDVVASFWDIGTSGQEMSAGGIGKATAEMQIASTFLEAGWDFVGESQNGMEDIWAICEGVDYPHLAWEFVIGDFDADADTDFADFCILAEHWLAADSSFWCGQGCDLTNDGNVDFDDLKQFARSWLNGLGR